MKKIAILALGLMLTAGATSYACPGAKGTACKGSCKGTASKMKASDKTAATTETKAPSKKS